MSSGRSISILTVLNVAGAAIGIVNSIVVAHLFGTSRALEVYFASTTLMYSVLSLTQAGQLAEITLPLYHKIKFAENRTSAQHAFSVVINWMVFAIAAFSVGLWFAAPVVVSLLVPGFGADDQLLGTRLFRWVIPLVGIQVVLAFAQTLINAERSFGKPEAVAVGARVLTLSTVLLLGPVLGIWSLVASLWIGGVVQLLSYVYLVYRMGYRHHFSLHKQGFSVRNVFGELTATFAYTGSTQVYSFLLHAGLSLLPQGTFAVYKYAEMLYSKTRGAILRPISIVFFTEISEALRQQQLGNTKQLIKEALERSLVVSVLAFVVILVSGHSLLTALWGGERFGGEELELAANLLAFFFFMLFFSSLSQVGRRITLSTGLVKHQYFGSCLVQLLSGLLAWVLLPSFAVVGLVAVIAFNAAGLGLIPLLLLMAKRPQLAMFYPPGELCRWVVIILMSFGLGHLLNNWVEVPFLVEGRLGYLLHGVVLAAFTAFASILVAWVLGVTQVRKAIRWATNKVDTRLVNYHHRA